MRQGHRTPLAVLRASVESGRPGRATGGDLERLTRALELAAGSGLVDAETVEAGRAAARGGGRTAQLAAALTRLLEALVLTQQRRRQRQRQQAHELRTPLTLIRANLRLLRLTPNLEPAVQAALLAELDADVCRLTRLLDDLTAPADAGEPA